MLFFFSFPFSLFSSLWNLFSSWIFYFCVSFCLKLFGNRIWVILDLGFLFLFGEDGGASSVGGGFPDFCLGRSYYKGWVLARVSFFL